MYPVFQVIGTIAISIICIFVLFYKKEIKAVSDDDDKVVGIFCKTGGGSDGKIPSLQNPKIISLLVLLGILFIFTRCYELGFIPTGVHIDELGMLADAKALAQYGTDRYGNPHPVYLINFGGGQSAMYAYLEAFVLLVCPWVRNESITVLMRVPAVIASFGGCLGIFFLAKKIFRNYIWGIVSLFLAIIFPICIIWSRWGLDCNLMLPFFTIAFCLFIYTIEKRTPILYVLAGCAFGLTLYTYVLSYLFIPLILLLSLIYLLYVKRITWKEIVLLGSPLFLFATPLLLMVMVNQGWIPEYRGSLISILKLPEYRIGEISTKHVPDNIRILFKYFFLFDKNKHTAFPEYGVMYMFSIPLFILGFIVAIQETIVSMKKRQYHAVSMLIIPIFAVLFVLLFVFDPVSYKGNLVFSFFILLIVKALIYIREKIRGVEVLLILLYFIAFLSFSNFYFLNYEKHTAPEDVTCFHNDALGQTFARFDKEYNWNQNKIFVGNRVPTECAKLMLYTHSNFPYEEWDFSSNNTCGSVTFCPDFEGIEIMDDAMYVMVDYEYDRIEYLKENGFNETNLGYEYIIFTR